MVKLKVPEMHYEGVAAIRALSDISARALASQLDGDYGHKSGKGFAKHHSVPGLSAEQTELVYDTLRELYNVREEEHLTPEAFAASLIAAMNDTGRPELVLEEQEVDSFKAKFTKLLSAKGFGVEAKINSLRRDVEHTYCSSRVITDIRPVFGDDVAAGPLRMLLMHTLRLAFHDGEEHDELYVALSDSQIARLIEQLQRAQEKGRVLTERFIESSHETSRK